MSKRAESQKAQQAQDNEMNILMVQRVEKVLEAQQSQIHELTAHMAQMMEKIVQTGVKRWKELVEQRTTTQARPQNKSGKGEAPVDKLTGENRVKDSRSAKMTR